MNIYKLLYVFIQYIARNDTKLKEKKMIGYHVTTDKKITRYKQTGGILPPVRFFPNLYTAQRWAKRTSRDKILQIECNISYPLPDHKPARWTNEIMRKWNHVVMEAP